MINIIAAAYESGLGIGYNGGLPWAPEPQDMARFRRLTMNHVVVRGRRTWESLPRRLAGRTNLVVTSRVSEPQVVNPGPEEHVLFPTLDHVVRAYHSHQHLFHNRDLWVIGGASLYSQALVYADTIELTLIRKPSTVVDTVFPPIPAAFHLFAEFSEQHLSFQSWRRHGPRVRHE